MPVDLAISGSDVFIVGPDLDNHHCYWQNNIKTIISADEMSNIVVVSY